MTFSSGDVLTAAELNDLVIDSLVVDTTTLVVDKTNNRVGIGVAAPERILDIRGASNPEIRLQSTDGSDTAIYFGDESDAVQAGIFFDNSENDLCFRGHDNITRFKILSGGNIQFDNTITTGANGSGQSAVFYSSASGSYMYWDHDFTDSYGKTGTLRAIGTSAFSTAGTTQSSSNMQYGLSQDYALYADNTGPGSDNSRMWINGVDGAALYIGPRSGSHTWNLIRLSASTITLTGAVTKTTGTFDIKHPTKGGDWRLRHSFIEGPNADNLYRGIVTLSGGTAIVDLDAASDMTDGTWVALNTNGWAMVASSGNEVTWSLSGNKLTINGPDGAVCNWLVIGERHDEVMKSDKSIHTNSDGKIIVEYENADVEACPEE